MYVCKNSSFVQHDVVSKRITGVIINFDQKKKASSYDDLLLVADCPSVNGFNIGYK